MSWVVTRAGERLWVGLPPGSPRTIYILCFGAARTIRQSDGGPLAELPGSHYFGITRRSDPMKRIKEHGAWCAQHVVELRTGTEDDEQRIKYDETYPRCGRSLNYYAERDALWRASNPDD